MIDISRLYSARASKLRKSEIRELLKVAQDPEVISFAGGMPNPTSFPIADLQNVARSVLQTQGKVALQYGTTEGVDALRELLSHAIGGGQPWCDRIHPGTFRHVSRIQRSHDVD